MKLRALRILILGVCLLTLKPAPAAAYWDDVHYHLTYFVARLAGFTPQQAYRLAAADLSADYHAATEPTQITASEALLGVPDPQPPAKQNPRWWFHAFRNQTDPRFLKAIGNGPGAAEADAAILAQGDRLFRHGVSVWNPGVFLHFLQDEGPHQGFGSEWGHWFNPDNPDQSTALARAAGLPIGGAVDWLDFSRHPGQPPVPKSVALDLVSNTARWLEQFMAEVSPRQKRGEFSLADTEKVIDGLLALGPAPTPLAATEFQAYINYRGLGRTAGLTPAQQANFRKHKDGPDLAAAEGVINAALLQLGMTEKVIPSYKTARTQYRFKVTEDSSVFPIDAQGALSQQAVDDWVLTGSLKVTVETEPGGSREPVEVKIKAPSTRTGEAEYDLTDRPVTLNMGSSGTVEQLPIGDVMVEVSRGGQPLETERVDLKQAQNAATILLKAPFDWSGRWQVSVGGRPIGVITFRKVTPQEFQAATNGGGYGEISILCSGTPYLGTYDYSSGGKVTGCPADLLGSELTGRYRDDNARVLSQEGNFVITGKPGSPRRFDGSFTPAGQGQSQPWSGIYLGQ